MVLIDELVAYAKKLWKVDGLPAGSFDNLISFVQEITEAARAARTALWSASIPESNIEIGEEGSGGQQALAAIEHTFGRMEAIWKPVAANEGFEIVRRRLFLDCKDETTRDQVCQAFSRLYQENSSDFPTNAKEVDYYERLRSCYPIHPEIFDRLYEDWATIGALPEDARRPAPDGCRCSQPLDESGWRPAHHAGFHFAGCLQYPRRADPSCRRQLERHC